MSTINHASNMIAVRMSMIPGYLRSGELYQTLVDNNDDPNQELTFCESVLKMDSSVGSAHDCELLLETLRFWGIDRVCLEVVEFVLFSVSVETVEVLVKFETAFEYVFWLRLIATALPSEKMACAIRAKRIELVRPLAESGQYFSEDACDLAAEAENGHMSCLRFLHEHGCPWDTDTCANATYHNDIACLTYAHEQGCSSATPLPSTVQNTLIYPTSTATTLLVQYVY